MTYGVESVTPKCDNKTVMFTGANEHFHLNVYAEDTIFDRKENGAVPLILTNLSDKPYTVKEGVMLGSCQVIDDDLGINEKLSVDLQENDQVNVKGSINNVECQTMDLCSSRMNEVEQYDFSTLESVDNETKEKLKQMLLKYAEVFSERPFGSEATGLMEHSIELTDESVKPIKHYGYRVSPASAKELQKNVEEKQRLGVIEESQSPWASPVLLVPKKDGTRRFCTDFRQLNAVTKSDVFPLPRIDDILDKLGGCQFFSSIDLKHAFWQIPMKESDKAKTAFICGNRLWQYRRMAFGLKNSPPTFQRCIGMAIGENDYSIAYLDDIIIFSKTMEDHLNHIESIMQRLVNHNLNAKLKKCEFFKTSLTFLGHIVSRDGIQVCPDKVAAIAQFPTSQNVKQLRSFLGMSNYYRKFISGYSKISSKLTKLLQINVEFKWTEQCQEALFLSLPISTSL